MTIADTLTHPGTPPSAPSAPLQARVARKLLIMSQKGGVGKTTTAINLAAAAGRGARILLADSDPSGSVAAALDLAWTGSDPEDRHASVVSHSEVMPGVDLLTPGDAGLGDEGRLGAFLSELGGQSSRGDYDLLIVDSPPFLGDWLHRLLTACDEAVLVMRAEPLSYRTLPPFLEAIKAARAGGATIRVRGIVLTLPPGELPGGRWETRMRADLGRCILPQAIPHDAAVGEALRLGRPVVLACPESPASIQYRALAESLGLTRGRD